MRSRSSELLSIGLVMAIPLGMMAILPYDSFAFKAAEPDRSPVLTAAFVRLSPERAHEAAARAKTSWQQDRDDRRGITWAELAVSELSEVPLPEVTTVRDVMRAPGPGGLVRDVTPFLPSMRAAPPVGIMPARREPPRPAFAREELLKID